MASEPISLEFLGEQIKRVQADIRDLKGRILLVESDQADLRRDMDMRLGQLETKLEVLSERMDDRFDQMDRRFVELFKMIATNLASLKEEIAILKPRS